MTSAIFGNLAFELKGVLPMLVELVKDGKLFCAECHVHDGYVVIYGERGSSQVDIHGFSLSQAAERALWNLARNGEIDPIDTRDDASNE